mmetsp:Transcript_22836/g.18918  ORF Transcript_22836/g.18918 Transcript_22836/m.18918 type:complete len:80 (-) Transcript_22836:20-259(-)
MWWEAQISGVCLIMMCLGMSQALVHRNGIVWREVVTIKERLRPLRKSKNGARGFGLRSSFFPTSAKSPNSVSCDDIACW